MNYDAKTRLAATWRRLLLFALSCCLLWTVNIMNGQSGPILTSWSPEDGCSDSELAPNFSFCDMYAQCSNNYQLYVYAFADWYCDPEEFPGSLWALNRSKSDIEIVPQGVDASASSIDVVYGFRTGSAYETQHCADNDGINDVVDNTYLCSAFY
jgi:hypothetical protein